MESASSASVTISVSSIRRVGTPGMKSPKTKNSAMAAAQKANSYQRQRRPATSRRAASSAGFLLTGVLIDGFRWCAWRVSSCGCASEEALRPQDQHRHHDRVDDEASDG